ncbi:MAG: anthranilate phosphoribosyltransferase [Desulfosudaceae bacterium]
MPADTDRQFGATITRLTRRQDLSRDEAVRAFTTILNDDTTAMQQGAFLAALATKGETEAEIAGAWDAIYQLDTVKPGFIPDRPLVENSGTGMDTFKTFNISTAAAVVAAAGGVAMARHGARSITSACGAVDMAEALGVDVECPVEMVVASVKTAGIGLFNGMSPTVHPRALGRILSQINFGSTLNIAASLANPVLPAIGLRGVYSREMIMPAIRVMRAIGYEQAIVLHGLVDEGGHSGAGMDEASICGPTYCARLDESGRIETFTLHPEDYGLGGYNPGELAPADDLPSEARRFVSLLAARDRSAGRAAILLNTALIFYAARTVSTITAGVAAAAAILESGRAIETLTAWVSAQNRDPARGLRQLQQWLDTALIAPEVS